MQTIVYDKNFEEYEILSFLDRDLIVVKGSDVCDVVNSDVSTLVFANVEKQYSQLSEYKNQIRNFYLPKEIKINKDNITIVKIVILGYDERFDRVEFNTQILNLKTAYKYSITSNSIELIFVVDCSSMIVCEFLGSVLYEYCIDEYSQNKQIFVYADGDLLFNKRLTIMEE